MKLQIAKELEPTSAALATAHEAHVHEAIASVRWARYGLLKRLTRADHDEDKAA
jgi:hypothetical protein